MLALRPTYTLSLFASFASVLAHGYVQNVMADGQAYPGWYPFVDPYVRKTLRCFAECFILAPLRLLQICGSSSNQDREADS
jgi:hypothetical protein